MFLPEEDEEKTFAELVASGDVPTNLELFIKTKIRTITDKPPLGKVLPDNYRGCESDKSEWKIIGLSDKRFNKLCHPNNVKASFDLHGKRVKEAWDYLNAKLAESIDNKKQVVEVVHGAGKGILRIKVRGWLERSNWVLGYCEQAHNEHALIVLLKKR